MSAEKLPLVTVVCNCYNHEKYLEEALNSVLNQSYTNIELIVVNNSSRDNSETVIRSFIQRHPSVKFINLSENRSHNVAFNLAFKESNGEYLVDLSGDDRLLPDCIEKQVAFFQEQDEETGLIFGNAKIIDESGNFLSDYFAVDDNNQVLDKRLFNTTYQQILAGGLCMCSVSGMMKRRQFEILQGYNENLFFEDLDYWLRLSYRFRIAFSDDFLVEKRELDNSLGNQFYKKNSYAKKINNSKILIYKEAIKRNSSQENKCLLKRIHCGMVKSFENRNFPDLLRFSILEIWCRMRIYFR